MVAARKSPAAVLEEVRRDAGSCEACGLWHDATQTVFGEGPVPARLMLVGEQPGDQEDKEGHPFVGPAGRVLADALEEAGIARGKVFVTNAVKHFKWKPQGKRRIHDKPNRTEIVACRPWLDQELSLVRPEVVIALGASAAQALLGSSFRLSQHRGEVLDETDVAPHLLATAHPSVVLRAPDAESRHRTRADLVADLHLGGSLCGLSSS